jgi:flagellar motor switch protein FliN/FliY
MTDTKTKNGLEDTIDEATAAVAVQASELEPLGGTGLSGEPIGLDHLLTVPVVVTVEIGRTRTTLAEIVKLSPGSILALDRESHEPVDILVNGRIVARGEVVTVDEKYGVRVTAVSAS